jgi:hypothetical protein
MVRFEDDKLVIELKAQSASDAMEKWMELQYSICDVIRSVDCDNIHNTFYNIPDFLRELTPDWDVAKKMITDTDEKTNV